MPAAWLRFVAFALWVAVVAIARLRLAEYQVLCDYALGCATAWVLGLHLGWKAGTSWLVRGVRRIARISYSLYLSHCPMLAFVMMIGLHQQRLPLGPTAFGWITVEIASALGFAALVWWGFERHTAKLRDWLIARADATGRSGLIMEAFLRKQALP
jgi:peptidoglycan/LPS O-acetylase OafA/YrhL